MLEVRVADRVELLLDELVDILRAPPADPFDPDWVAVPSIGMRRWLAQRLAERLGTGGGGADGVTANVELPFPSELRRRVLAADNGGRPDPWEVDRLLWTVLEVLDGRVPDDPTLEVVRARPVGGSLIGRAAAVADLFDRYSVHRPGMVLDWLDGRDVDATGAPLADHHLWQPALFRAVRDRLRVPPPAVRLGRAVEALAAGRLFAGDGTFVLGADDRLPSRLVLFGPGTLSPDALPLLHAVGKHRDVHLLVATPSVPAARSVAAAVTRGEGLPARRTLDASTRVVHPLLASWSVPALEAAAAAAAEGVPVVELTAEPTGDRRGGLLARIQQDLRADHLPEPPFVVEDADRSFQVHACTGESRQVEVLRDLILHLLADDPTLTEGDIAVLCPRIEAFTPIIRAVLGPSADELQDGAGSVPRLRYRITDRSLRSDIPLLGAVGRLLDVLPGRFPASEVADLLASGPVADRFRLGAEDLVRLDDWIEGANIRWGVDGAHRSRWQLPEDFTANAWSTGIDQVLMGTAVRGDDVTLAAGGIAPLPIGDGSTASAGRLAEAVRTLAHLRERLVGRRLPIEDWCRELVDAVDLMCSLPPSESWQRRRLERVLSDLVDEARDADGSASPLQLDLAEVRRLLAPRLGGDPARASVGTGAVTFCSLLPLRGVPHRTVCILGLDQDALPRGVTSGDDLLASSPLIGDRDPRLDARQLLLEAVLSAGEHLVITIGAVDVRNNLPVPPAVVLDEFWETVAATCGTTIEDARDRLCVTHPRQAVAAENFVVGGLRGPVPHRPWSHDQLALDGAEALLGESLADGDRLLQTPLPPSGHEATLPLDRLRRFVTDPLGEFFSERLGVFFPRDEDRVSDHLLVGLEPLSRWKVGTDLIDVRLRGLPADDWVDLLRARGALPPGPLADDDLESIQEAVDKEFASVQALGLDLHHVGPCDVDTLVGDRRIVGVVESCVGGPHPGPVRLDYSERRPKQHLIAALDLLALTATRPEVQWRAVSIARKKSKGPRADELVLEVAGGDTAGRAEVAERALAALIDLREQALRLPLPIFERTSAALQLGERGTAASRWASSGAFPGEGSRAAVRAAFGELDFDDLLRLDVDGANPLTHAQRLWSVIDEAVVRVTEDDADDQGNRP